MLSGSLQGTSWGLVLSPSYISSLAPRSRVGKSTEDSHPWLELLEYLQPPVLKLLHASSTADGKLRLARKSGWRKFGSLASSSVLES